jgi:hypothetical protein
MQKHIRWRICGTRTDHIRADSTRPLDYTAGRPTASDSQPLDPWEPRQRQAQWPITIEGAITAQH